MVLDQSAVRRHRYRFSVGIDEKQDFLPRSKCPDKETRLCRNKHKHHREDAYTFKDWDEQDRTIVEGVHDLLSRVCLLLGLVI